MADHQQTATGRCTHRKHVIENGQPWCDCRRIRAGQTVAKNALVVTVVWSSATTATESRDLRPGARPGTTTGIIDA